LYTRTPSHTASPPCTDESKTDTCRNEREAQDQKGGVLQRSKPTARACTNRHTRERDMRISSQIAGVTERFIHASRLRSRGKRKAHPPSSCKRSPHLVWHVTLVSSWGKPSSHPARLQTAPISQLMHRPCQLPAEKSLHLLPARRLSRKECRTFFRQHSP